MEGIRTLMLNFVAQRKEVTMTPTVEELMSDSDWEGINTEDVRMIISTLTSE